MTNRHINPDIKDLHSLLDTAIAAARAAAQAILQVYMREDFEVTMKPGDSPLTLADVLANQIINRKLSDTGIPVLSEENAEIPYHEREKWEYLWLVDPLDGTREFISRNGEFTVNIALVQKHTPIAGVIYVPVKESLYAGSAATGVYKAEGDIRGFIKPGSGRTGFDEILKKDEVRIVASRSHLSKETETFLEKFRKVKLVPMGSSLKFMMLLEGKADCYPRLGTTMEWDTAAAHAILNAANRGIYTMNSGEELIYNKPDLRNPFFLAY